jgi:tol-pal system protein YbgF
LLALALLPACGLDHTGRSASYLLDSRVQAAERRVGTVEKDLGTEIARVDVIEERAEQARQRLADSGATLETFIDEVQSLRGEIAMLRNSLDESTRKGGAVEYRLASLEYRLGWMEQQLKVKPPPPMPGEPTPASDAEGAEVSPKPEPTSQPEPAPKPEAPRLAESTATVEPVAEVSPEDAAFQEALLLVQQQQWERAGGKLQKFVKAYPQSEWAVEAQFLTGRCLYELGRYKQAISELEKAIQKDPKSEFAPKAMYLQGLSFEGLGTPDDLEAAKIFFGELVRTYPKAADAERAKKKLEQLGVKR